MKAVLRFVSIVALFLLPLYAANAQNIYELRKFTDENWLDMSTEERLKALNVSNNHPGNQTFVGDFGRYDDLYPRWGYDYYEMENNYENYAFRGFKNYNILEDRRSKWYYNQFGDRLTKMTRNARIWSENYKDAGTSAINGPSGYINQYSGGDGIWVVRESTNDWALSVIGAGAMRVKFTPLTLSLPNLNGMKADFQSANYEASIINSEFSNVRANIMMLRGGQFRRKFGALVIGANYVNMYGHQTTRENGETFKGTIPENTPTPLFYAVRIMDDSPQDGDGPTIYDVKLKVDGAYRPDIKPQILLDDYRREFISALTKQSQKYYLDLSTTPAGSSDVAFTNITVNEHLPKYLDYIMMNDYAQGTNVKNIVTYFDTELGNEFYKYFDPAGKPFQLNGNEFVVYIFDLTNIKHVVRRVQAEVTVSNDYRVQVAEIFTKFPVGGEVKDGDYINWYNTSFWKTMAQAEGNIKDDSNLTTETVDFAWEVANTIYGFDVHFNYLGFKIDGEYVNNVHHYMFSDGVPGTGANLIEFTNVSEREGKRSTLSDNAYYLIIQKDWNKLGFSGEYFKMGKFYRPYLDYSRGGFEENYFSRLSLIGDNDDNDRFPDVSDDDGVFPGNDQDNDGIADNERNFNGIPDYDEPFLMFDSDPDEFIFGNDFNNNNIPDFREDDIKFDTPYELDRQGHHINLRFTPQANINFYLGSLRSTGIGLDTRNYDDYFKLTLNYDVFSVGNLYAEYRYHEIQDNVQDSFVVVDSSDYVVATAARGNSAYTRRFYFDEREYRNSKLNKLFLESKIRAIPSITLENHIKYERNNQLEGTMYDNTFQPKDILTTFAMVNKFIYTKQLGNWTFSPGLKFRFYKKDRSESLNPLDHYLLRIPLVFLKYSFSSKTIVTFGVQGFKGFELLYKDYIQSHNDYRQINYLLEVSNRTSYFGFDVWGGFGFKLDQLTFEEEYRNFDEHKTSMFFLTVSIGY